VKCIKLISVFIAVLLAACATSRHKVDQDALDKAKGQTFHIGRIEIPCDVLAHFPWPPFRNDREYQQAILENISVEELRNILSDAYGLHIASDDQFIMKSSFRNLFSDSYGRCWYKENGTAGRSQQVINVSYDLGGTFAPPMPSSITMGYSLVVKSDDDVLIELRGDIETLRLSYFFDKAWNSAPQKIIDNAKKIPDALRRDISKDKSEQVVN
jgi:hypothetical protein